MCNIILYTHTDTTDVQSVTATVKAGNTFLIHCDFINGSNAEGCMIVLVGEFDNITTYIERDSSILLNITFPLMCYYGLIAFDIESNGSVGTFAVPGELMGIDSTAAPCLDQATISTTTSS